MLPIVKECLADVRENRPCRYIPYGLSVSVHDSLYISCTSPMASGRFFSRAFVRGEMDSILSEFSSVASLAGG